MSTLEKIKNYLHNNNVEISVEDFISTTSNIYHSFEAEYYDKRHFGIKLSEKYWNKTTNNVLDYFKNKKELNVLDFGCGTGYVSSQIINNKLLNDKISEFVCFDLSPEMIEECKKKYSNDVRFSYFADKIGLSKFENKKFDLITCNALIHHIIEPEKLIKVFLNLLNKDGILIIGHEPNSSYYKNKYLQLLTNIYRLNKKIYNKLKLIIINNSNTNADIVLFTYKELLKKKIININFPIEYISKFVDIHVPMSTLAIQPWGEIGFDANYFIKNSNSSFELIKQFTYNHIKDQQAYKNLFWRNFSKIMQFIFPNDGADIILILKKVN